MDGKIRRLRRIIRPGTNRTVIAPVDDSLIYGPRSGLADMGSKLEQIAKGGCDAVMAHLGTFRHHGSIVEEAAWIVNLTASTVRVDHTQKEIVTGVAAALSAGADAVAVHVNLSGPGEGKMLRQLGLIGDEAARSGLPLLAIAYPRRPGIAGDDNYEELKVTNMMEFTEMVCHCARVAKDLGADLVKTFYTGSAESFEEVVACARPVPVVAAGGALLPKEAALANAEGAIRAGAAGVAFGRNVFSRTDASDVLLALNAIVHRGLSAAEVLRKVANED